MKRISKLVLILIIFNFILSSFFHVVKATDPEPNADPNTDPASAGADYEKFTQDDYDSISENGTATIETESGSVEKKISVTNSTMGAATGNISAVAVPFLASIDSWMSKLTAQGGLKYVTETAGELDSDSDYGVEKTGVLTIYSLVFGEYLMFNGKSYETTASLNQNLDTNDVIELTDGIREKTAGALYVLRNVALVLSFFAFIYSLARALASQTAKDLAVWKKVLGNWLVSVVLLMFIHVIVVSLNTVNDTFMDMLWKMRLSLEDDYPGLEVELLTDLGKQVANTGGNISLAYSVEYVFLGILQLLFLVKYAVRALMLLFLPAFAPIVIVVNSIRSMAGKDNDLLISWFKKYCSNLFMQPIHALFYLILIVTVSQIAIRAPLFGILMLYALYRAEKIAQIMFNMQEGTSVLG